MSGVRQRTAVPAPININGPRPNYSQPSPMTPTTAARVKADAALLPPVSSSPIPRWFSIYYALICSSIFVGVALWFIFWQNPHHSHVSYDPLVSLPTLPRLEIQHWYQNYRDPKVGSVYASGERSAQQVVELLGFLERFQHAGYFDPVNAKTKAPEHYVNTITEGWIAGVFERVARTAEAEADKAVSGSPQQEGTNPERKRQEALSKRISAIVDLLDADGTPDAVGNATWSRLTPEHRTWVLEGLAHCHASGCRLLKLALVSSWRDRLARDPKHPEHENWKLSEQLFHPETVTESNDLLDAPASAASLAGLWFRFFGSGNRRYVDRLIDLAALTGAQPYQAEKDREAREWYESKMRRRAEAKEEAAKEGRPAPKHTPLKPLPASPTAELHGYFVDSLRYYASQHSVLPEHPEHPLIAEAVVDALRARPEEPTLGRMAADNTFARKLKDAKKKL